jgi:hypothetical protein
MAIIIDDNGDKKDYQVDDNECKITRFSSSPTRTGFKERGLSFLPPGDNWVWQEAGVPACGLTS